jgi:hypothetical protein
MHRHQTNAGQQAYMHGLQAISAALANVGGVNCCGNMQSLHRMQLQHGVHAKNSCTTSQSWNVSTRMRTKKHQQPTQQSARPAQHSTAQHTRHRSLNYSSDRSRQPTSPLCQCTPARTTNSARPQMPVAPAAWGLERAGSEH